MYEYIIRKSQKISSAVYLITSSIKDEDSMKWRIREEAMSFISLAGLFSSSSIEREANIQSFISSAKSLIYLLNTSYFAGLISKMNSSIVMNEIEALISFISKESQNSTHLPGYILSTGFFNEDQNQFLYKSQNEEIKSEKVNQNKDISIKDKKNIRQEGILDLLKKKSDLTIKDFVKVITNCSEKTIQRELIELVKKGAVKRVGERRWSTYSLA